MSQIIFIVGLQKSGTTLLNRLLSQQSGVSNPFKLEGRNLWGDNPPFSPSAEPCGRLYQEKKGTFGHSLSGNEFNTSDQALLLQRIHEKSIKTPYWINKNPYNSVRIPWLKKQFPDSIIVAMVRNPVANVFSLLKKYQPHEFMGYPPENGWWGVKPKNWLSIENEDKLVQSADQWLSVNREILEQLNDIDHVIKYHHLCADPVKTISQIINLNQQNIKGLGVKGTLTCNDNEYLYGSRLLSKNRDYLNEKSFSINSKGDAVEILPLKAHQITMLEDKCLELWQRF